MCACILILHTSAYVHISAAPTPLFFKQKYYPCTIFPHLLPVNLTNKAFAAGLRSDFGVNGSSLLD